MEEITISAKSLEEAITKACVELGVTSDKLKYKIVTQGSNGFFGLGAKNYVISASSASEIQEEVKAEPAKTENKAAGVKAEVKKQEATAAGTNDVQPKEKAQSAAEASDNDNASEQRSVKESGRRDRRGSSYDRDRRRDKDKKYKDRDRSDKRRDKSGYNAEKNSADERAERPARQPREIKPVVLAEDPVERAKGFLEKLFASMEMKIDYSGEYNSETCELTVNLSGDDMGILIGKRGQTLDALQYLTSQVVNKHQNGYIRVKLDTENYRERRKETLETFAVNMAHKVERNNRPIVLEPMNAYERRIIHSVLQQESGVVTRSEGEEPYRHVVICPVKKKTGKQ